LKEKKLVNAEILVDRIRKNGKEALYLPTFEEIVEYLMEILRKNDIILTLGAGPVDWVANLIVLPLFLLDDVHNHQLLKFLFPFQQFHISF